MFSVARLYDIYNQFLNYFPVNSHGLVSVFLAVLLVVGVYKVLRKQLVWVILLVILLPASGPILKHVWEQVLELLKFLLIRR